MSSASIGIIGGADGPTAIFVAYPKPLWPSLLLLGVILIAGVLLIRWAVRHRKRK